MNFQRTAPSRGGFGPAPVSGWRISLILSAACAMLCVPTGIQAADAARAKTKQVSALAASPQPTGEHATVDSSRSAQETSGLTPEPAGVAVTLGPERCWEVGVTQQQQRAARQLLGEGNSLWNAARFSEAAEKFTQALANWDHPRIHYNLALALIALNRPLEVHDHLQLSMRYGRDALTAEQREWAGFHLRDLETKRLSAIDVRCESPGAEVRIDGRLVFTAPGWHHAWVLPGPHTISTAKRGYISTNRSESLKPGLTWVTQTRVYTKSELTRSTRRWPSLVAEHLMLAGAGAALLAVGGALTLSANAAIEDINERCRTTPRCVFPSELSERDSRASELRDFAAFSYIAGGSMFVTGMVLTLLNLKKTHVVQPPEERPKLVRISPMAGGHTVGVIGKGRF